MAKVMPYTSEQGINLPVSYWNIAAVAIVPADGTGSVLMNGYASKQARVDSKVPAGQKSFILPKAVVAQIQKLIGPIIYQEVAGQKVVPNPTAPADVTKYTGFFDGAGDDLDSPQQQEKDHGKPKDTTGGRVVHKAPVRKRGRAAAGKK